VALQRPKTNEIALITDHSTRTGIGNVKIVSPNAAMSGLGQKQILEYFRIMSALPPKADMVQRGHDVRFVPKADSCTAANKPII
jgi:hypothetical protein